MKLERRRVTFGAPDAAHAQRDWPERYSVLVRVSDSLGRAGVGEASPLPGYGRDTLEDAEAYARSNGIPYTVQPAHTPTPKRSSYPDNFRSDRKTPWTH